MLTAEVNHFSCQISLVETLDILCSIRGCSRADLGALLWGRGSAAAFGMRHEFGMSCWCRKHQCTSRQGHQTYGGDPDWSHFPNVWIQNCQDRHGGTPKLKVPSAYWKALYVCNLVGPLNFTALLKRHCLSFHVWWSQISPPTVEHKYCCSSLPEWLHQLWRSLGGAELG